MLLKTYWQQTSRKESPSCLPQDISARGKSLPENKHAALRPFPWGTQIIRTVVPDGRIVKPSLYALVIPDNLPGLVYKRTVHPFPGQLRFFVSS